MRDPLCRPRLGLRRTRRRAASRGSRRRDLRPCHHRGSELHRARGAFYFRPRRNLRWAVLSLVPAEVALAFMSFAPATITGEVEGLDADTFCFRRASMTRCCTMLSAELVNMYRHKPAGKKSMKLVIMVGITYSIILACIGSPPAGGVIFCCKNMSAPSAKGRTK